MSKTLNAPIGSPLCARIQYVVGIVVSGIYGGVGGMIYESR